MNVNAHGDMGQQQVRAGQRVLSRVRRRLAHPRSVQWAGQVRQDEASSSMESMA